MPMGRPVVLIAEDERPIATLLAKLVEGCGAETAVARNGGEALRWMRDRRPDLLLLDLIMPVMGGEDVLKEMQEDAGLADVPVIVITTKDMRPDSPHQNLSFLQKPFAPAEVTARVRGVLGLVPPGA
jgi:CheY-like chemotaxis protein